MIIHKLHLISLEKKTKIKTKLQQSPLVNQAQAGLQFLVYQANIVNPLFSYLLNTHTLGNE